MNLAELSHEELIELQGDVNRELDRRSALSYIPEAMDQLNRNYLDATGHAPGEEWTPPTGAHDAYPEGFVVERDGKRWRSTTRGNVWEPGQSGWREIAEDGDEPAEWKEPTGAHDAYQTGDEVTFEGTTYRSAIDGNVWSPTGHPAGWEAVE